MKYNNKTSNVSKVSGVEKRLSKLERYRATHTGDVKKITVGSYFTPTTGGDIYYLSPSATGDTFDDRTGLVINAQSHFLGLNFQATKSCSIRVLTFIDRFQQGVSLTTSDVLAIADVSSPMNYANTVAQKRLRIIHDKTYSFSLNGTLQLADYVNRQIPMKIRYTGSSTSPTFAGQNSVYLLIISDTATPGQVGITSRILFTDE